MLTELPPLSGDAPFTVDHPARALAECEAKRRIIYWLSDPYSAVEGAWVLEAKILPELALPYADHPDYRDEWRP